MFYEPLDMLAKRDSDSSRPVERQRALQDVCGGGV